MYGLRTDLVEWSPVLAPLETDHLQSVANWLRNIGAGRGTPSHTMAALGRGGAISVEFLVSDKRTNIIISIENAKKRPWLVSSIGGVIRQGCRFQSLVRKPTRINQ